MKVLILGGSGMLGHKLVQVFNKKFDLWTTIRGKASDYSKIDIFDDINLLENIDVCEFSTFSKVIKDLNPDVIINAIGVIKQKQDSKDIVKTIEINSIFPRKTVEIASKINARFITISTDCVFDGEKGNYREEDLVDAKDLYGKSKYLGEVSENNCLTLRTSIIGRELQATKSLFEWFISQNGKKVKGYINAIFSGFPTIILAEILADIVKNKRDLSGLYHLSSEPINKYELLCLIKSKFNLDIDVEEFEEFQIDRSLDSAKFRKETGFSPKSWETMIEKMAKDRTPYDVWRMKLQNITS